MPPTIKGLYFNLYKTLGILTLSWRERDGELRTNSIITKNKIFYAELDLIRFQEK